VVCAGGGVPFHDSGVAFLMSCACSQRICCSLLTILIAARTCLLPRPWQVLWAFCVYLEAVSVLPQLRMMQKAKVVEKFTAHYVFALGLSRFISCAHWILQVSCQRSS
jgi:ER lumen protein retaining receptor